MNQDEFDSTVERRQRHVAIRDAAQKEIDEITPVLSTELVLAGEKARPSGEWNVTLVDQTRTSLSKEKLLEAGVPMEVIEKATVKTPTTSLRVARRGK